jgi:hypothetical protein
MRTPLADADTLGKRERLWLNPLMRFTKNADRDPLELEPGLADSNGDGKKIILTPSGMTLPPSIFEDVTKKLVKGDIDIIADVRDQMNDTFKASAAPFKIGYHVASLFDTGVDPRLLRTAADPYVLATFDDNWFKDQPSAPGFITVYADDGSTANRSDAAFDQQLRIKKADNDTIFPFTKQYTITNAKGNDGRVANVDDNQYWNTNAKNISTRSDTDAKANFAGDPDTTKNAEARFKDGDWEIHVMLTDLVNPTEDAIGGKIRLDNFKQVAKPGLGGAAPPAAGLVDPLYDPTNTTSMLTEFAAETAGVDRMLNLGDSVGILGEQMYPDLLMKAYILPHKNAWTEDNSFADAIASIFVKSDANGLVPLTLAWTANKLGLFDTIIDYDRDGMFSATLDGLGGFQVVPEPSSLALFGAALLLLRIQRSAQ